VVIQDELKQRCMLMAFAPIMNATIDRSWETEMKAE